MNCVEEYSQPKQLKRSLGLWSATAINVGAIIGGGIFVVTGIVADHAGSAMVVSIAVAAVVALFTALTFAELSGWQPVEGSAYEYTRQLVSPFAGFLKGDDGYAPDLFVGVLAIVFRVFHSGLASFGFPSEINPPDQFADHQDVQTLSNKVFL